MCVRVYINMGVGVSFASVCVCVYVSEQFQPPSASPWQCGWRISSGFFMSLVMAPPLRCLHGFVCAVPRWARAKAHALPLLGFKCKREENKKSNGRTCNVVQGLDVRWLVLPVWGKSFVFTVCYERTRLASCPWSWLVNEPHGDTAQFGSHVMPLKSPEGVRWNWKLWILVEVIKNFSVHKNFRKTVCEALDEL